MATRASDREASEIRGIVMTGILSSGARGEGLFGNKRTSDKDCSWQNRSKPTDRGSPSSGST